MSLPPSLRNSSLTRLNVNRLMNANVFLPMVKIPNVNKLYDELSAVEDSSDANFTFVFILAEPRWP